MQLKYGIAPFAVVAAMALTACGSDDDTTTAASGEETTVEAVGAPGASVSFVAPEDGAESGDPVAVEVAVDGFELNADAVGTDAVEGEGHLHFAMDGGEYDNAKYSGPNGELAEQLGVDGMYSPSTTPEITYTGLPAGEHTLEVYLANNDHSDSGVEATTTFTVK